MSHPGDEMDSRFSELERRVDTRLGQMATSVDKLATSVQLLVERDIRVQERETNQLAFNERVTADLNTVKIEVKDIVIARATEKYAMDGLKKFYPYLVVAALMLAPFITEVGKNLVKFAKGW